MPGTERCSRNLKILSFDHPLSTQLNMTQVFGNRMQEMRRDGDFGDEYGVWTGHSCFLALLIVTVTSAETSLSTEGRT